MKPFSSANGMNSPGAMMPFSGWLPAYQGLEAADLVALEIDLRLVVKLELAARSALRRSHSMLRRARMRASISGSKKRNVPRPSALAR